MMANFRARFNELRQIGKVQPSWYPTCQFDAPLWTAISESPYGVFESSNSSKNPAIENVLSSLIQAVLKDRSYCCKLECFESPETQVDGVACRVCRSYNYCKCRCKSHVIPQTIQENLLAQGGSYSITFLRELGMRLYEIRVFYEDRTLVQRYVNDDSFRQIEVNLNEFIAACIEDLNLPKAPSGSLFE